MTRTKYLKTDMRLITSIAKKFASDQFELDELIGEASVAYAEALYSYNPSKSRLTTWTYICMKNHLLNFIRFRKSQTGYGYVEMEDPVDYITPEDQVSFAQLLECIEKNGKKVCDEIFSKPYIFTDSRQEMNKNRLVEHLRESGWDWSTIWAGFWEVKEFLEGI